MKLLLISLSMAAAIPFSAQNTALTPIQKERPYNDSLISDMKRYIEARGLKSGVIRLSQDGMPCVIPNMQLINPIPNAWQKNDSMHLNAPNTIPNPARPKRPWVVIPIKQKNK